MAAAAKLQGDHGSSAPAPPKLKKRKKKQKAATEDDLDQILDEAIAQVQPEIEGILAGARRVTDLHRRVTGGARKVSSDLHTVQCWKCDEKFCGELCFDESLASKPSSHLWCSYCIKLDIEVHMRHMPHLGKEAGTTGSARIKHDEAG